MSNVSTFNLEQIDQLKMELKTAPVPPKKLSKKEAVQELKTEIQNAHAQGQTIESLQSFFGERGLKISQRELKEVLGLGVKKQTKMAAKRPPKIDRNPLISSEEGNQ